MNTALLVRTGKETKAVRHAHSAHGSETEKRLPSFVDGLAAVAFLSTGWWSQKSPVAADSLSLLILSYSLPVKDLRRLLS